MISYNVSIFCYYLKSILIDNLDILNFNFPKNLEYIKKRKIYSITKIKIVSICGANIIFKYSFENRYLIDNNY